MVSAREREPLNNSANAEKSGNAWVQNPVYRICVLRWNCLILEGHSNVHTYYLLSIFPCGKTVSYTGFVRIPRIAIYIDSIGCTGKITKKINLKS